MEKHELASITRRFTRLGSLAVVCLVAAACTSRTSVDIADIPGSLFNLISIDNTALANLSRDPSGRAYFNQCSYSFQGSCSRGVAALQISVNGVQQSTYYCPFSSNANFSYSAPANGSYDFAITPIGYLGGTLAAPTTVSTFCKVGAPPAPTMVEPSPMFATGTVVLHGSFSTNPNDAISGIIATGVAGALNVDLAAGTFTFSFPLTGGTYFLGFQTKDYAGNVSVAAPIEVIGHSIIVAHGFTGVATAAMNSSNQLTTISSTPLMIAPAISNDKLYGGLPAIEAEGP